MKRPVEYFDTDFLDNKIEIGDKVIFEAPKYRDFVIGTVITKAPKSCQIEYLNTWNYPSRGRKEVVRQYYGQIIKYPVKEGKWLFPKYAGEYYYKCSCCGIDYPVPPTWNTNDVKEYLKFCSACGAKMTKGGGINMRVTTTYKYPAGGTRNGRVYPPEVLKKAFEEPQFRELCITKSIPVMEYEHDRVIGFATASLEDGIVTTIDASIFDPLYISAFKELGKSTDSFGFALAGTGATDHREDKTYITDITFDKAYVLTKGLAIDCHTVIHKED